MKYRILIIFFLFLSFISFAQETVTWPKPTQTSKPWTRWWWMGNAVDKENLARELSEMKEAGIGGVEITPIYGVKGEENRFIEYLSPKFTEVLKFTISEAGKNGMGVDLPPGSGWRCGGPFVPESKGLWSLKIHKFDAISGKTWYIPKEIQATAVSFKNLKNEIQVLIPGQPFLCKENGVIYVAERIKNRDMVKRAADGGTGWAIDTFNDKITNWYLDEFWTRLGINDGLIRCFFHDSFEYTGDFTTHFTEEFKKRRGYDMSEYLYVLAGDCKDSSIIRRFKSDYRETLSDLVLESFIQPMTKWAKNHKSLNRNQAHGSPGNILDLYAACDIPETEIFRTVEPGKVDVFVNKFASSAAHVTGKKLVSSESFTWLEEHWNVTTSDMIRATNRFFLAGINHMFFHGTCYSPADAEWPGWLFYASTQINNRNPLWREFPTLFKYIERTQTILQKSDIQNDVLVYWPFFDVAADPGRIFTHLGVNKDAGWFKNHPISGLSEKLKNAGYSFDYISDRQLADCKFFKGEIITSGGFQYKALVVPETEYIPVETFKVLQKFIALGGKVFFDKKLPESVPGIHNFKEREIELNKLKTSINLKNNSGDVCTLLLSNGVKAEKGFSENGLDFLKLKKDNEIWYLVVNCNLKPVDEWIIPETKAKSYFIYNAMNGEITLADSKQNAIHIQLEPEQSLLIKCSNTNSKVPFHKYWNPEMQKVDLTGNWKVDFIAGGPQLPKTYIQNKLGSWTLNDVRNSEIFSGTARYTLGFDYKSANKSGLIDFGKVNDCARIKLNNKTAGVILGPTYKIWVNNLNQGKNILEVEVTNVAANRIRDLDKRSVNWKKFYDINFVNLDYKPFDASEWKIRDAGLIGPVTLSY